MSAYQNSLMTSLRLGICILLLFALSACKSVGRAQASGADAFPAAGQSKFDGTDTLSAAGKGTSNPAYAKPMQKLATAKLSARIEAERILSEACPSASQALGPHFWHTGLQEELDRHRQQLRPLKVLHQHCTEATEGVQAVECLVVVAVTKPGLKAYCTRNTQPDGNG